MRRFGKKLAVARNRVAQLIPAPKNRLVRHLGIGPTTALGCCRDEKAVEMIRQLRETSRHSSFENSERSAGDCRYHQLAHLGALVRPLSFADEMHELLMLRRNVGPRRH